MSNKNAVKYLERLSVTNANYVVARLVEGGYIEDIPMSEPERLAEGAKKWLGKYGSVKDTFNKASGWSTDSWKIVMNDEFLENDKTYQFNMPWEIKWIFDALVILAKEAGVL